MPPDRGGLLSAFDAAIAAVRRLESASLETSGGESAGPLLARLRGDLEVHRADIATGAALDREWAGRVVRWVAGWLPDHELPLIASLGRIVRLGTGG